MPTGIPSIRPRRKQTVSNEAIQPVQEDSIPAIGFIRKLVGAAEFKELAEECMKVAPYLQHEEMKEVFTNRCYLISINDGHGLSTCLGLFAYLTEELKLFQYKLEPKAVEVQIPPDGLDAAMVVFHELAEEGLLVCFDISEWMTRVREREFRDFLRNLQEYVGKNIVFFRVPFVEKNVLSDLWESLNDVLSIRTCSIPPFSMPELDAIASEMLTEKGFTAAPDLWELFHARVAEEKKDGRFYGISTVRKIVLETLYLKQLHTAESGGNDRHIRKEEILSLVPHHSDVGGTAMEQLDALVGMESIRSQIEEILVQIRTAMQNQTLDAPCIHMRFVGNPGTGKTTVARILGKLLKEQGLLQNGQLFEHYARDLCGKFIGETAPKTAAICRDAYGGILFIDEAYALFRGDDGSGRDFGREAIDTLVTEMENHRSDLMVIMAGYPDEMEQLLESNKGLKSRMPYRIEFPNYTGAQLAEIFLRLAEKSFIYDDRLKQAVTDYFGSLTQKTLTAKTFSNGRFVRNVFERTWAKAALRCQLGGDICRELTAEDFLAAVKNFQDVDTSMHNPIGFSMM